MINKFTFKKIFPTKFKNIKLLEINFIKVFQLWPLKTIKGA